LGKGLNSTLLFLPWGVTSPSAVDAVSLRVQIERIQNPTLYRQYINRKMDMDVANGTTTSNERRLWHGTAGANVVNINSRNFNRSYSGAHGK
jgi:hypothetical protein